MSDPAAGDPLEALIEAWDDQDGDFFDLYGGEISVDDPVAVDITFYVATRAELLDLTESAFAAGRDAQREDDAQIDWLQLVRDHDMQGYVCSCGADVNEQDWHLALSIQAAIGSSKPTEEDN